VQLKQPSHDHAAILRSYRKGPVPALLRSSEAFIPQAGLLKPREASL